MKVTAISLALFSLLGICVAPVRAAQDAANLAGKWALTAQESQGTQTRILTIAQNGDKLSGTLKSQLLVYPVEGAVDGNKVTLTVKVRTPKGLTTLNYTGTTEGDSMKGTVKMDNADVPWTATQMHE